MKKLKCLSALVLLSAVAAAQAQRGTLAFPHAPLPATPPVPAVWVDTNFQPPAWSASRVGTPVSGEVTVNDQKLGGGHAALIPPDQARKIMDRFKAAYRKLGSPRLLLYVNHELPEGQRAGKQTLRDVERAFGRPLQQAAASLVDQKIAAELFAGKTLAQFIGTTDTPQSRQDREALGKIADVVIEVLVSSKPGTAAAAPELQATAIRLSDSKILGQASSTDATNRVPPASLPGYSVAEITETTALALMEDLATNP